MTENKRLTAGASAPEFEAETFDGQHISSKDYLGKQKVWLIFYRYANCPICHHHFFELGKYEAKLKAAGIQVFAVFESPKLKFGKLSTDTRFPKLPLVTDPDNILYEAYGVEKKLGAVLQMQVAVKLVAAALRGFHQGAFDGKFTRVPAHFLIQEDGTIQTAFYGDSIADHIPWQRVEEFIKSKASQ